MSDRSSSVPVPVNPPPVLTFHGVQLPGIEHEGQVWIKASDLARALGYTREDNISLLYRRNAKEFRDSMTQVIEIATEHQIDVLGSSGTTGTQPLEIATEHQIEVLGDGIHASAGRTRIFSLRGCHLIAMLVLYSLLRRTLDQAAVTMNACE